MTSDRRLGLLHPPYFFVLSKVVGNQSEFFRGRSSVTIWSCWISMGPTGPEGFFLHNDPPTQRNSCVGNGSLRRHSVSLRGLLCNGPPLFEGSEGVSVRGQRREVEEVKRRKVRPVTESGVACGTSVGRSGRTLSWKRFTNGNPSRVPWWTSTTFPIRTVVGGPLGQERSRRGPEGHYDPRLPTWSLDAHSPLVLSQTH